MLEKINCFLANINTINAKFVFNLFEFLFEVFIMCMFISFEIFFVYILFIIVKGLIKIILKKVKKG